ncbi:hypothetical protein EB118_06210 [bacterium]|nr:hypothetical protein [bacterium]NBX98415.1 hypothetical protein [bacterium]NDC94367.1 hypothetical protein [bacterium]NDD83839.1 hypothetical protein [bacterium]NDG29672.1 hypothetical protein [bacterium]
MSEQSYQDKVRKGLTGPDAPLPVCYPTAFDRLSTNEVSTESYLAYVGFCAIDESAHLTKHRKNSLMTVAMNMIATDIGLDSWRDLGFANESSEKSFCKLLRHMVKNGYGVILDIDATEEHDLEQNIIYSPDSEPHGVGLVPLNQHGDLFTLTSSWLPKHMQGPQTPEDVFDHLVHQSCPSWNAFPFHDANVTYFPLNP